MSKFKNFSKLIIILPILFTEACHASAPSQPSWLPDEVKSSVKRVRNGALEVLGGTIYICIKYPELFLETLPYVYKNYVSDSSKWPDIKRMDPITANASFPSRVRTGTTFVRNYICPTKLGSHIEFGTDGSPKFKNTKELRECFRNETPIYTRLQQNKTMIFDCGFYEGKYDDAKHFSFLDLGMKDILNSWPDLIAIGAIGYGTAQIIVGVNDLAWYLTKKTSGIVFYPIKKLSEVTGVTGQINRTHRQVSSHVSHLRNWIWGGVKSTFGRLTSCCRRKSKRN